MLTADYLLELQHACADDLRGQEAIEYALMFGGGPRVQLPITYCLPLDTVMILEQMPAILENYHRAIEMHEAELLDSYQPLLQAVAGLYEQEREPSPFNLQPSTSK